MSKNSKNGKGHTEGGKPKSGTQGVKNDLGTSDMDVSEVINSGRHEGKK